MVAVQNIKYLFMLYRQQRNNFTVRKRRILAAITLKLEKREQLFLKLPNLLKHKIDLLLKCNFSKLGPYQERFPVNFPNIFGRSFNRTPSDRYFFSDHRFVAKILTREFEGACFY